MGPLIIAFLIAPRSFGPARDSIYECGMPAIGSAWIQVAVIYYLFALLFLAFDVDVLFLFPVLLAYGKGYVWRDFIEITIFIGILSLVIVYAWCRGVFSWKRKQVHP
ncbi:MAG: NADH-quinone oxidoreductase subunit A [Deltaproteobacteria bacterium]|nr:NADH-quinone oxidoreductase subunit A [Deltaproteobacteria bacterium]